jgi:hypothetical protein
MTTNLKGTPAQPATATTAAPGATAPGATQANPAQPAADPKADRLSPRFAAIAREEKRIREERAALKAEREQFAADPEFSEYRKYRELKKVAKTDPKRAIEFMEGMGMDYNTLTKLHLNNKEPTPEMIAKAAQERIDEFEKRQREKEDEEKKKSDEASAREEQQQIAQFQKNLGEFLKSGGEKFELVNAHDDPAALVYNVIERHFIETEKEKGQGEILDFDAAAEKAEALLWTRAEKFLGLKKVQAKMGAKATDPAAAAAAQAGKREERDLDDVDNGAQTLRNLDQTEVPPPVDRKMSVQESKRHAARMLRFQK